jgi:deoxyribodipyrimidine photo-lyase
LHHSLEKLSASLGGMLLLRGDPTRLLPELARRAGARGVYWNRCYEPHARRRDQELKTALSAQGLEVASFNASLLFEPWEIRTGSGGAFRVYTPFWRACLKAPAVAPRAAPRYKLSSIEAGDALASWKLRPASPNWAAAFDGKWQPGETGAKDRLGAFLKKGLSGYAEFRDHPDLPHVSRLSPHLHFGEISPRQIRAALERHVAAHPRLRADADKFLAELGWREFSYHLLYHFPHLPEGNWRPAFDAYPWLSNPEHVAAWQAGRTGYPLVDAGMRELWSTGYIHNRVRMVAASFLVKHLRIDWRQGESWFWDTLVDADLANNAASWQWVAGSGADAAPYFRIFNPMQQGRRFDPEGAYVRRWCPEIARLPSEFIHAPFEAPPDVLVRAGVRLGDTYPHPLVEHAQARRAALEGYEAVKAAQTAMHDVHP